MNKIQTHNEDELWAALHAASNAMIARQQNRCSQIVGTITALLLGTAGAMLLFCDFTAMLSPITMLLAYWVALGWPQMPTESRVGPLQHHPATPTADNA